MFSYKIRVIQLIVFLLSMGILTDAYGQAENTTLPDLNNVLFPPLEQLFENAKKNPGVAMYETKMEIQESMLTSEQRSWLKYFKLGGSYQYGSIAVNSAFTNENTPLFYQTTGQTQNSWYGTAGLSIPLDDLFDRGNKVKRHKLERKFTELEMEKWLSEQRIRITESYMTARMLASTLRLKVDELNFAQVNYELLSKEFKIGNSSLNDLNIAKRELSEANDRMMKNQFDLLNELIKLELLSDSKIISK